MCVSRQGISLWAAVFFSLASVCHAQSAVTPETEYKKLLRVNEDIQPLGEKPFGEHISLYNGSLSFEQTDISLPGNGPLMQLSRSLKVSTFEEAPPSYVSALSDWDLEIPHLETVTANRLNVTGWIVAGGTDGTTRCTNFAPPPAVSYQKGYTDWLTRDWWTSGYQLVMPGEGSEEVMRVATGAPVPQMSGVTFPLLTKNHWAFSCLGSTDNGEPGEGFKGVAPDGTSYWFNHLIYRDMPVISRPSSQDSGDLLPRRMALMLVTRVQDRFGNYLTYTYSGANLTTIKASDGRQISLQYVPGTTLVASATAQATDAPVRTWTYQYTANTLPITLSNVILPDGSAWTFDLASFAKADLALVGTGNCDFLENLDPGIVSGTITHPSGLVGTFQLQRVVRGRSYVLKQCWGTPAQALPIYATFPDISYQFAIVSRAESGAGLPTQTWTYRYSAPNASWSSDSCASSNACPSTEWTDAVDPDGRDTRYTFSNRFDVSEGVLQRIDYFAGAYGTAVMRSELNAYANPTGGPWPSQVGYNLETNVNNAQLTEIYPVNQRTISQDGDNYTWQALAFNAYAQPTDVKRYNTIAGQSAIEEATTYLNDPVLWVLGLPLQTTNVTKGEVESLNTYNPSNDMLQSRARFGQTLMSYTFHTNGNLASFTDGKSNKTSLSNYYRGIPRTIVYPDSTSETLVVDDLGQIRSITDQAGRLTGYNYDFGGRVNEIDYPTNDEQPWANTFITTTTNTATPTPAERGLAAGHWKRTITTGGATTVTYFDAMLRPVLSDSELGSTVQASTLTTYDAKGQKLFSAYPSGSALTFSQTPTVAGSTTTYDALGRTTQVQQTSELGTLTSSTAYLSGARQQVTDPKSNVTTTSYQVFDQPAYDAVIQVQAPAGITQTIARDIYGNPLSITQAGPGTNPVIKSLFYDSYYRLCRTTEPESGSEIMHYDDANNLDWSASGLTISPTDITCAQGQVATAAQTARTYDAMNRVTTILPPAGTQSTSYGYDPVGRLTSAVSGISTWSSTYNFRGMLTSEALQLVGQNAWGLGYAHDANGSLSLIHYPDGENVSYAPDALGRPTQAGSYASSVGYFPNGQVAQFAYANGTSYVAAQNARQMLSNFSYGPGSAVQLSEDLAYDPNGNISTVTDLAGGPRNKSFGYDALNRLTSANAAGLWGTQAYTYDALNNLRTLQTGSQTSTYHYDPTNKLASISSGATTLTSYLYDTRGNVTGKNAATLVFDQKNQLTQIAGSDTYAYDASGRRVSKTAGGITTYYFYSQAGQLMYQWAPGSALSTSFIYLGSRMVGDNESLVLVAPGAVNFDANPNNGSYTVSWPAVSGATGYAVQESANGGTWTTVYSNSGLSVAMSGKDGGSYLYQVRACAGNSPCTGWTASATLGVRPVLSAITVPTGTINGTYTVSWTAPASASAYMVQESLNGGAWSTIASSTAATSISRPGTTSGSYTYQVAAYNAYGTRGGVVSSAVTVDTTYGVLPTMPATLTVPASSNNGSATLSWSAATLATRYVVQQSSNGGGSWTGVYNSAGTSAAVASLADGSYVFQVQACNTYGCSAWQAGGATLVVTHLPTTAPTVSVPANSSNGSYTVSWSGVAGQVSYTLQEQVNGGGWSTVQTNGMTSWSTSGRSNGTYGYRVQACNVGGCGPWSATGTTTVLLPPPSPASISVPATSSASIAISWAASATATTYGLDQSVNGGGWAQVYANSATSTSLTVGASGSYSYRAYACNASGCNGYAVSSAVAVTIPPASAPSLSVPASSNTGSYSMSWSGVDGATSYTLQESINGGGWSTVQASGATSWSTSGRGNGNYGYHVQGCNAGGCGPWSGTGSVTVALVPPVPGGLHTVVVNATKGSYTVAWNAVGGATRYDMQQTLPNGTANMPYSGANTTASALDLATQGQVLVQARACNANGCSGWSASIAIMLSSN
jgi:hypothetical protein